jgi:hypothetical protein
MGCHFSTAEEKNAKASKDSSTKTLTSHVSAKPSIDRYFCLSGTIGVGHFSKVVKATSYKDPSKLYAIKQIRKSREAKELHLLRRELKICKEIEHEHIIRFEDVYEDADHFYIAMEY